MKKYYIYAAVSILGWSTVATVVKLLLGSLDRFQVLQVSALFAALFLLAVNLATGNIKKLKAYTAKISNLAYITPALSLVWTWLILKEQIRVFSLVGLAVIMVGILIQIKFGKRRKKKATPPP